MTHITLNDSPEIQAMVQTPLAQVNAGDFERAASCDYPAHDQR